MKILVVAGLFVASFSILQADTLILRTGQRVDGSYVGGDSRSIRFAVGDQVNTYSVTDIGSIQFSGPQAGNDQSAPPPAPAPPPPPPAETAAAPVPPMPPPARPAAAAPSPSAPTTPSAPIPPATPAPDAKAGIDVPAGTQIVVRLIDPVNSELDSLGQTYRASVDQPVVANGETVIPRGADAVAALVDAQQSGKIQGRTVLTLDLRSITVDGRTYDITTGGVSEASASRGARSAKVIGATTALGAIIGGIAGGGKGAAIGAGSGAGVGTAAQVATSGQKVKIPSETSLTFTLQNALNL